MKKADLEVMDELKKWSMSAYRDGYFIEAAIIVFQTFEQMLRILISGSAKGRNA